MTSRLELRHTYPEPPERMAQVLVDPDYLRAKLREVGGPGAELVSRTDEGAAGVTVVLRQAAPSDALPSYVRSLVPGDLTIERTETWEGTRGRTHAAVDGTPGVISGTMALDPDGSGCALGARIEATVPIPLVGGKVEKVITDNISRLMEVEYAFTLRWLRDRSSA